MPGTFYEAPPGGGEPFVTVGQQVAVGDVLGIVEAMEIMNQIEANKAGVVTARLVKDGAPVGYDEPLFTIA
ncbi:acetyl-CoA carboxylase biotin carboxyl carrier protein [Streptomyces tendae]|uniref:Biotin carboxyl carrier protein of acetyl-CoA carboxylase n=1 Tax=Streptomyces tendae TaxID=1932 RepID=A0ABW7RZT4_STRTE